MSKKVYWANLRNGAEQAAYIELNQISKGRWKVTLDMHEYTIKCSSTDPFEVLQVALSHHLPQSP